MSVVISGHGIVNQDVRFTPKSEHLQRRTQRVRFAPKVDFHSTACASGNFQAPSRISARGQ